MNLGSIETGLNQKSTLFHGYMMIGWRLHYKRLFELLRKACMDARYKKSYKITKEELEYLADRVKKLRILALRKCREKIDQYKLVFKGMSGKD